jgi:signal transduction histidine kinase
MRRRISLTMFAMVVGSLLLAGLITLGLTRLDSIHKTQTELVTDATRLAESVQEEVAAGNHHDSLAVVRGVLAVLKAPLNLQGEAIYGVRPDLSFYNLLDPRGPVELPSGLRPGDVETANLVEGLPVTGHRGGLAWAALLFSTQKAVATGGPRCPSCQFVNLVVVLTRQAPTGLGDAGTWFGIAAAATVVVSLLVATRLGRRIARPLQQAEEVTGRIAAGDLSARVPVPKKEGHELVSLANSVNKMAASLALARGAQRQFLMSVSHDLRTPLTSIRGYAEALAEGATDDVPRAAGVILSEARRLERLVGDLLELAKLEAGTFSLACVSVDLCEVVAATVEGFEPAATALGLQIVLNFPGAEGLRGTSKHGSLTAPTGALGGASRGAGGGGAGAGGGGAGGALGGFLGGAGGATHERPRPVFCYADPDRLGQVVANVVENALKYATAVVSVTATYGASGEPTLVVEDDGPGIPPADLHRVFQRLYQSASAASRKLGSGLGLAIVRELVTAMGGEVRAESPIRDAGGTRMVVVLRQPASEAGRARQTSSRARSAAGKDPERSPDTTAGASAGPAGATPAPPPNPSLEHAKR